MKNVLLNHSILILTRNRPQWIEYSLNFYKHYQYKGEIIIADDSSQDFFNKNYKIISSFEKDLKINPSLFLHLCLQILLHIKLQ